jgi:hypothetical protein
MKVHLYASPFGKRTHDWFLSRSITLRYSVGQNEFYLYKVYLDQTCLYKVQLSQTRLYAADRGNRPCS